MPIRTPPLKYRPPSWPTPSRRLRYHRSLGGQVLHRRLQPPLVPARELPGGDDALELLPEGIPALAKDSCGLAGADPRLFMPHPPLPAAASSPSAPGHHRPWVANDAELRSIGTSRLQLSPSSPPSLLILFKKPNSQSLEPSCKGFLFGKRHGKAFQQG